MAVTLSATSLLSEITQDELDEIAGTLLEGGQDDPITASIDEADGIIQMYVNPRTLKDGALTRIWKLLSIAQLYTRIGNVPEKRQKQYDWCIKTLEEIRDGKFPAMVIDTSLPEATVYQGAYGGPARLDMGSMLAQGNTTAAEEDFITT